MATSEKESTQIENSKNHTIKKINFNHYLSTYEQIKAKLDPDISIALEKEGIAHIKNLHTRFYVFLPIAIVSTFYVSWLVFIPLYLLAFSYLYRSKKQEKLSPTQIENVIKSLINQEYNKQLATYRKEVGIVNYIPEGLKYEALKLLTSSGNNYYNAETSLIDQAFRLQADGIINVTLNSTSSTQVNGRTGEKGYISSSVSTTVYLQGMAIKLNKE
ncbi:MAG: hypothetical protein JW802_02325 [Campylobacterales bacterium]|nr:hypothetical protein [Campylobacterales bacterium]MBN2831830.1 hypothetical protein [Campylobacterales bacterium]